MMPLIMMMKRRFVIMLRTIFVKMSFKYFRNVNDSVYDKEEDRETQKLNIYVLHIYCLRSNVIYVQLW